MPVKRGVVANSCINQRNVISTSSFCIHSTLVVTRTVLAKLICCTKAVSAFFIMSYKCVQPYVSNWFCYLTVLVRGLIKYHKVAESDGPFKNESGNCIS